MNDKKLNDLFKRYHSSKVAEKLLRKLEELTPAQIGKSILATKLPGQRLVNLEKLKQ